MLKVTFLLPVIDDCDGVIQKRALRAICGGYTSGGQVTGEYTMDDGSISRDICELIWVVCQADKLPLLKLWAREVCRGYKQESIYCEYHEIKVTFLRG